MHFINTLKRKWGRFVNTCSPNRTKWLMYTVVIGLLPIAVRALFSQWSPGVVTFTASDFIAFGFVLHISILNEIEHIEGQKNWKTWQNGLSIAFIFLYGVFSCAVLAFEAGFKNIDIESVKHTAIAISMISFLISLSIFYRPNRVYGEEPCQQTY